MYTNQPNGRQITLRRIGAALIDWPLFCTITLLCTALLPFSILEPLRWLTYPVVFPIMVSAFFALFESSRLQATPGKLLFKLKVVDTDGNPVSIWQGASNRFLQIALIAVLINASSMLSSLGDLFSWDISSVVIFFLLFGLLLIVCLILRTLPFESVINRRVAPINTIDTTTQYSDKTWSANKAFAIDLSKGQCLCITIALLLLGVLPCLSQSFRNIHAAYTE